MVTVYFIRVIELNMVYWVEIKYNAVYTMSAQRRVPEIIL